MSDIKVSRAWAEISKSGGPCVPDVTVGQRSGDQLPCVLVWLKDFNTLSTDAERWRSHLIISEKEKRLAEISANFEEIMRDVEALSPSVGENASETIAGFPVVADPSVSPGTVEARIDADVVGRVTGLDSPSLAEQFPVDSRVVDDCGDTGRVIGHMLTEVRVAWDDGGSGLVRPEILRLGTVPAPSLAERFPVGRMAKVVDGPHVGRSGPITGHTGGRLWLLLPIHGIIGCLPANVELLPKAPTPQAPKVGDKVRICGGAKEFIGMTGTIASRPPAIKVFDYIVGTGAMGISVTRSEIETAPTDPAPAEPSKAAFAAWKHRVPVVGERVRALTPNRYGQLGTVNAPAKFDNDADRHGQVVIVSAKMDTGEVVVNGIQWWEPAEPIDGVSLVTDAAMDEMRRKLATAEKERDEARAKLSLAQVAESFLDSRMTRIRTTLDRVFPAIEEAAQGPRVLEPWEQIERIAKERDEARAERDGFLAQLTEDRELEAMEFERAYMLAIAPAVLTEYFAGLRHKEYGCEPDWTSGVASTAQRLAAAARAAMFPTEGK